MLLQNLKNAEQLTKQEESIRNYILQNLNVTLQSSAYELALLTYTSPATIIRFCKKMGTKGFPDFKTNLAKSMAYSEFLNEKSTNIFNNSGTISDMMNVLPNYYQATVYETIEIIKKMTLAKAISTLLVSSQIDFYADGLNYHICQKASIQLGNLGFNSQVHLGINQTYLKRISQQSKSSVANIIVSHTGENASMINCAKYLFDQNLSFILIGKEFSTLAKMSSLTIPQYSPKHEHPHDSISYTLSLTIILDLIYSILASSIK